MKAIKIDRTGAVELVEGAWSELCEDSVTWDAVSIERTHSLYFDDFELFAPNAVVANIGVYPNVPLPASSFGLSGENGTDVSFTVEEVVTMVTDVRAAR